MAGDDRITKRERELESLNLKGAATAPKPAWAGKKWKDVTQMRRGGMVDASPLPGHVGPGTTSGSRDYGK